MSDEERIEQLELENKVLQDNNKGLKTKIDEQSKEIEELKDESNEYQIGFAQGCYEKDLDWKDKIKAKNEEVKDVTKRYENMIEAFECDFNLPFNYNDFTMFDDLKRLIKNKNKRLVKDIELLQELSFGIRYGNLKIIDKRNKLEGIIWN